MINPWFIVIKFLTIKSILIVTFSINVISLLRDYKLQHQLNVSNFLA